MNGSVAEIKNLIAQIAMALKPVPQQYKGDCAHHLGRLGALGSGLHEKLQEHNTRLVSQEERGSWAWKTLVLVGFVLLGILYGRYAS